MGDHSISVIIPTYNAQDFIEECLDSVENQTYFKDNGNFEVLVGVDGCQKTLEKVLSIRNKYRNLKVFMMEQNKGTYITINTLISLTSKDNIITFGSDDIMKPIMISELSNHIDKYDIIKFSYNFFEGTLDNEVPKRVKYAGGAFLMGKKVTDLAGGYRDWLCSGDEEFITRIKNHVKIFHLDKELFYRRKHENSLTQKKSSGYNSELRKKYKKQVKVYNKNQNIYIKPTVNSYKEY